MCKYTEYSLVIYSRLTKCFVSCTAFIVFYRNKDVRDVYYEDRVKLLWDSGPQKILEKFSSVNQLISFKEKLNQLQKQAIHTFLTRKVYPCTYIVYLNFRLLHRIGLSLPRHQKDHNQWKHQQERYIR